MRDKILNISAIIPKELYVKRDADRKLKEVIQLMSKPAYVSVSRQMGKTNLLINARRELQDLNNRYVFIDITGSFTSAQECFRYIINQILNSNEEIEEFEKASIEILEKRKNNSGGNSTEEFQSEIRTILKYFKGNLIIFLDEVDDLRKHAFSDEIFGQIRKTYFIRETYSNLNRVTYVLSGVIDPEKLIKSKENSPFNIAIPIYLQDFSFPEFEEFVERSKLPITSETKIHIYDWISGNPRMTYDLLSQIEDEYLKGADITNNLVDDLIQHIYLDGNKQPPVDHIRDLVKHNTDVRKTLINLKKGEVESISDELINKLFLFGIIKSKVRKNIAIKNKVIENCLSDDWLEKIELEKRGYYEYGTEKIKQGLYEEGIRYLNEFISNDPKGSLVGLARYFIGEAYYKLEKYNLSNEILKEKPIRKESSSELYFFQILYIGITSSKLDKVEDALKAYNEIIEDSPIPQTKMNAFINKGEILYSDGEENIIDLYNESLEYLSNNKDELEDINKFYTISYFRLGCIYHNKKDKERALPYFEKALSFAEIEQKPEILLYIDSCYSEDSEKRKGIYSQIAEIIIQNNLTLYPYDNSSIIQFHEVQLILSLTNLYDYSLVYYNKLLEYSIDKIYKNEIDQSQLAYKVANFAYAQKDYDTGKNILESIINMNNPDLATKKNAYQSLGLIISSENNSSSKNKSIDYFLEYLELFRENQNFGNQIDHADINVFAHLITHYREIKNLDYSREIASIIEEYFTDNMSAENKANSLLIYFYILDYYSYLGDTINILKYGEKISNVLAEIKPLINELSFSFIDKKTIDIIERQTLAILNRGKHAKPIMPIKVDRAPGRNELVTVVYKDGRRITTKYKKVMYDIENGECIIDNN